MIIDSSAIIAILKAETESTRCLNAIGAASHKAMSAASYLEASIVADNTRPQRFSLEFENFLVDQRIAIEPVTEVQAKLARIAHRRYGKGSGHPARLNFGDCFAYALARDRNEPLLFVGDDFSHTDIRSAFGG